MDESCVLLSTPVPKLREITSFHIASRLWRLNWIHYKFTSTRSDLKGLFGDKLDIIASILDKIDLSDSNKKIIMTHVYSIVMNLGCWTWSEENTCYAVSDRDENAFVYFPRFYDHIVWQQKDFTIDVKETVANMLLYEYEFNDLQRFKLACSYCFEDVIDDLWPTVTSDCKPDVISLISSRFVRYWIERKKTGGVGRNLYDEVSIIKSLSESNLPAYEYFWNRLNDFQQMEVVLHFVKCDFKFPYEYIFPRLTQHQWIDLVNEKTDNIMFYMMRKYSTDGRKTENILRVWDHVCDMMDTDVFILMMWICIEHDCKPDKNCLHKKIWNNAPDHLREAMLHELFDIKCEALSESPSAAEFFQSALRSVRFDRKCQYLRKLMPLLTLNYTSSDLSNLLRWCFTNKEIDRFYAKTSLSLGKVSKVSKVKSRSRKKLK
ncbi:uncharacterized protein LOC135845414 [Planococcus citri]|uniref:uncharacterized protein LOC135845414 n=1 Tax=Planococcus citri TaxID=170843 RepID=UPI0031F94BDD